MGCFGDKTEPEKTRSDRRSIVSRDDLDDDDFDGPMKDRSCRDVICLIIFAAYLVFMGYLFVYSLIHGDIARLTRGYDVSGNVCGEEDNDKHDGVLFSGENMENKPYLAFNLVRTAQILGDEALDEARSELDDPTLEDVSSLDNFIPFCVDREDEVDDAESDADDADADADDADADDAATDTEDDEADAAALHSSSVASIRLSEKANRSGEFVLNSLKEELDALELSRRPVRTGGVDVALLTGEGDIRVFRLARAEESDDDATEVDDNVATDTLVELAELDVVSNLITGGGSCRYCVEKCPDGTAPVFSRCLPDYSDVEDIAESFYSGSGLGDFASDAISDIKLAWREIVYMCLAAVGLTVVVVIMFRFLVGWIVYIILGLVTVLCLAGTAFLWWLWYRKDDYWDEYKDTNHTIEQVGTTGVNLLEEEEVEDRLTKAFSQEEVNNYLTAAIVASVFTVVVLLIMLVLRKRIALVVQLFKEAGKAVAAMPFVVVQPLWTFLALVVALLLWTAGMLALESVGDPEKHSQTGFVTYEKEGYLRWMRWYYLFGGLWVWQFIVACQHVVIAGAIASWYFAKNKGDLGWPILTSMGRLIRYHLGSVALGSFVIAVIKLIRAILLYVEKKLKEQEKEGNVLAKPLLVLVKCCQCCMWCFEKLLKYLNKNAYIEIAIYGYGFCTAARKAFVLLTSNVLRVAAINSVGAFVLFLGKLVVIVATIFIGIEIIEAKDPESDGRVVQYKWVPVLLAALFAYVIADCFISVYGMAIDTIFLCFCEDSDRNDGVKKPYFMSKGLMQFVENSNEALEAEERRKAEKKARKNYAASASSASAASNRRDSRRSLVGSSRSLVTIS